MAQGRVKVLISGAETVPLLGQYQQVSGDSEGDEVPSSEQEDEESESGTQSEVESSPGKTASHDGDSTDGLSLSVTNYICGSAFHSHNYG